jgi:small subunit ribosomal protein S4
MGKPKFSRKKYETPSHPWEEDRIKDENELIKKYGLKNKREIWKAETRLRNYRQQARGLLAKVDTGDIQSKKESEQLLLHLNRMNILPPKSTLDDVLALDTEAILSRRLQTLTYLKGLANTPNQARQLIAHGHIAIGSKKVTIPSYMVTKDEETEIAYIPKSPLNDTTHPARPRGEFQSIPIKKEEKPKEEKPTEDEKVSEEKPDETPKEPVGKEQPVEPPQEKGKPEETTEDKPVEPEGDKPVEEPIKEEEPIEPSKEEKSDEIKEENSKEESKPETDEKSKKEESNIKDEKKEEAK